MIPLIVQEKKSLFIIENMKAIKLISTKADQ